MFSGVEGESLLPGGEQGKMGGQRVETFSRSFPTRGGRNGVARSNIEVKGRFLLFLLFCFSWLGDESIFDHS